MTTSSDILKEFREHFVEMHPSRGHDMQNRPILYDMNFEKVEQIEKFIHRSIKQIISEIPTDISEETRLMNDRTWVAGYATKCQEINKYKQSI